MHYGILYLSILYVAMLPRGSRYLVIKELGLKDHDHYGVLVPKSLII